MEIKRAVTALSSLAQESRLEIFRMLVKAGPEGMPAGKIAEEIKIPANTLSFHIKELANAGLIRCDRQGQKVHCSADPEALRALEQFFGSLVG